MSRVTTVGIGVVALIAMSSTGCKVTVETKDRFVEDNVTQEDTQDWAGESIKIDSAGVGIAVNGGLTVVAEPGRTRVKAVSRMLAMAFQKSDADQSIVEAKQTFKITRSGQTITVACGHGQTHGESNGGESGCEAMTVYVPAGTATNKLNLEAASGNGSVKVTLSGELGNVGVNGKGDIDATMPASKGASISLVAEQADDVVLHLPGDFAANEILLEADQAKIKNDFTDAKIGAGAGGRGTRDAGANSIKLTSKTFAGSTGTVHLTR